MRRSGHLTLVHPVLVGPRPECRPIRLTRRGRVVVVLLILMLIGGAAAVVAPAVRAAEPAPPPRSVVVEPGDTLWSIAARHVPSGDPFGTIARVRALNGLSGYVVHPGQRLLVPGVR